MITILIGRIFWGTVQDDPKIHVQEETAIKRQVN